MKRMSLTTRTALTLWMLVLTLASTLATASDYVTYLHADVQGSPLVATDEQGNVVWQEDYEPWGARQVKDTASATVSHGSKVWYTGKEEEASLGLYYYGARWYAPEVGQFTGIDPAGVTLNNPRSFNRYAYANNNPIRYVDPDGRIPIDTVWDGISVAYDVAKIGVGYATGNAGLVAEGSVDLAADSVALAVPYMPAGSTKLARMLGKGGNQAADGADDVSATVRVSRSQHPESAGHIEDAVSAGQPATLTIDRAGATARRRAAMKDTKTVPGHDRDEYPPAMFREGGSGASVRSVKSSDNRGAGACIGAQCRGLPDGAKVNIEVTD